MEEINLTELFNYFVKKCLIIIFITMAFAFGGIIYGAFVKTPLYQSSTTVILISESSNEQSLTNNDVQLNKNLVPTYSEIVKSRKIVNETIDNLSLEYSYSELSKKITVSSLNDTQIIKITVTDEDKEKAFEIANELGSVFVKEIPELYNISNVNILDKAIQPEHPYNINIIKDTVIFTLIGLVLSCGLVFVLFYFDRSINTAEQIEEIVQLPVLGKVHEEKGDNK